MNTLKITSRRNLICLILFAIATANPQQSNAQRILSLSDLSSIIDAKHANPEYSKNNGGCPWITSANVFPINGCHTFTVTQSINYVIGSTEISTTVTICCNCALCIPFAGRFPGEKGDELPKSVRISESSTLNFDNYQIRIASGTYDIDSAGNYVNLKFSIIENK